MKKKINSSDWLVCAAGCKCAAFAAASKTRKLSTQNKKKNFGSGIERY